MRINSKLSIYANNITYVVTVVLCAPPRTSKEMEVQLLTLSQAQLQGKIDDMQSGADRLLTRGRVSLDKESAVDPDTDEVIAQASALMEAAASEKETLEASVQDMKTMVTALEDAVQVGAGLICGNNPCV